MHLQVWQWWLKARCDPFSLDISLIHADGNSCILIITLTSGTIVSHTELSSKSQRLYHDFELKPSQWLWYENSWPLEVHHGACHWRFNLKITISVTIPRTSCDCKSSLMMTSSVTTWRTSWRTTEGPVWRWPLLWQPEGHHESYNWRSNLTMTSPVSTSCRISRLVIGPFLTLASSRTSFMRTSVRPKKSAKGWRIQSVQLGKILQRKQRFKIKSNMPCSHTLSKSHWTIIIMNTYSA